MVSYICIFDVHGVVDAHAFDQFGGVAGGRNSRSTSKGFEDGLLDCTIFVTDFDLEFHDVTACWGANKASTYISVILVEAANISWILIMINDLFVVGEVSEWHVIQALLCLHVLHVSDIHRRILFSYDS